MRRCTPTGVGTWDGSAGAGGAAHLPVAVALLLDGVAAVTGRRLPTTDYHGCDMAAVDVALEKVAVCFCLSPRHTIWARLRGPRSSDVSLSPAREAPSAEPAYVHRRYMARLVTLKVLPPGKPLTAVTNMGPAKRLVILPHSPCGALLCLRCREARDLAGCVGPVWRVTVGCLDSRLCQGNLSRAVTTASWPGTRRLWRCGPRYKGSGERFLSARGWDEKCGLKVGWNG